MPDTLLTVFVSDVTVADWVLSAGTVVRRSSVKGLAKATTRRLSFGPLKSTDELLPPQVLSPHVTIEPSFFRAANARLVVKIFRTPETRSGLGL